MNLLRHPKRSIYTASVQPPPNQSTQQIPVRVCPRCQASWPGARDGELCPNDRWGLVEPKALETEPRDPLLGRVLGGDRFVLLAPLGKGGFGAVYRGWQWPVGREVAIKVILPEAMSHPQFRQRFQQEARAIARLRHGNTVSLFDHGVEPDGLPYMVLELVPGKSLAELRRSEPLPPEHVVELIEQVLRSLAEAHELGIVHRDIKPANIMIVQRSHGPEVKVLDFGIAKMIEGDEEQTETSHHIIVGSTRYMAPEQVRKQPLSPATDVYAVGLLMYELLTGKHAFAGYSGMEILHAQVSKEPPPLPDTVPSALRRVVEQALRKPVAERFPHAGAMLVALRQALGGRTGFIAPLPEASAPVAEDPTSTSLSRGELRLEQPEGPSRRVLGLVLAGGAGVAALGLWLWSPWSTPVPSPRPEVPLRAASTDPVSALDRGVTNAEVRPAAPDAALPNAASPDAAHLDAAPPDAAQDKTTPDPRLRPGEVKKPRPPKPKPKPQPAAPESKWEL